MLDAATDIRIGCRAVSFLTCTMLARSVVDHRYRRLLSERVLFPANRRTALLLGFAGYGRPMPVSDPVNFVPALLSYMSTSRRVLLVGQDKNRLLAARAQLAAQAPWHTVSAMILSERAVGRHPTPTDTLLDAAEPDVVIVDSSDARDEARTERYLSFRHDGLVILASDYFDAAQKTPTSPPVRSTVAELTICSPKKFSLS